MYCPSQCFVKFLQKQHTKVSGVAYRRENHQVHVNDVDQDHIDLLQHHLQQTVG